MYRYLGLTQPPMRRGADGAKVLVLANSAWNLMNFRGGLINTLLGAGCGVVAVAPEDAWAAQLPVPFRSIPLRGDGLNPVEEAGVIARLVVLFRSERPDVVLSFTPKANIYGGLAARLTGVRLVPNISGLGTAFIRGGVLKTLVTWLYRLALARCPVVFFQNSDDRDIFLKLGLVRSGQVRMLPGSGVDLERFRPTSGQREGPVRFLFVGRLLGDKGVRELAAAMRLVREKYPEATLTVLGPKGVANRTAIGDDELNAWMDEGLLHWAGSTNDVGPYLAEADAVVLPSYREGLPRSLLEGAAMGLPLIATDVPGNREIVQDGVNGLLCKVRSAESLADALTRFIALSTEERRQMGEAARRTVEQGFGEERVFSAYLAVVRSLVA